MKTTDQSEILIVDLYTRMYNPDLWAKDLWEALFRHVNAHEWRSLNNLLIDLKNFEEYLTEQRSFYWGFIPPGGITQTYPKTKDFHPVWMNAYSDNVYLIEFVEDRKKGIRQLRITKQDWQDE